LKSKRTVYVPHALYHSKLYCTTRWRSHAFRTSVHSIYGRLRYEDGVFSVRCLNFKHVQCLKNSKIQNVTCKKCACVCVRACVVCARAIYRRYSISVVDTGYSKAFTSFYVEHTNCVAHKPQDTSLKPVRSATTRAYFAPDLV
jgi:hypothetical protein